GARAGAAAGRGVLAAGRLPPSGRGPGGAGRCRGAGGGGAIAWPGALFPAGRGAVRARDRAGGAFCSAAAWGGGWGLDTSRARIAALTVTFIPGMAASPPSVARRRGAPARRRGARRTPRSPDRAVSRAAV